MLALAAMALAAATSAATAQDAIASYCLSRGGTLSTAPAANGNAERFCTLKDGTRLAAAAYFRNKHRLHH